ncbi:hypothetical protein LDENG_00163390 [Lucifuga dentata]|nr:hypothetical protein LDENG_00163390 [Lucifuga dentata]
MLFGEEVPYFQSQSKTKAHGVRVSRNVVLEAKEEYVVRGNTHFREPVKGEFAETTAQPGQLISSILTVPQHLQELYAQSSTKLKPDEQLQLAQLLCTYGSVFSTGPADLGCTSLVQHDIITWPGAPVKQPPCWMAWEKQQC